MGHETDGLVARATCGDAAAFASLVELFTPSVRSVAARWSVDADDLVQDTFIDAYLHLGDLRAAGAFPVWLRRIARKHADRQRRARRTFPIDLLQPDDRTAGLDVEPGELDRALGALPPAERLAVALTYLAGAQQVETAAFLGVPLSTIKARLRRARAHLRRSLTMSDSTHQQASGPTPTTTALFEALRAGDQAQVRALLTAHPLLANAEEDWGPETAAARRLGFAQGGTPLIRAIERDEIAMVRSLIAAGADVNAACGCAAGEPPLWTAVVHGRVEHVRELLAHGADPSVGAFRGATPLHVAAMRGDAAVVEILLEAGATTRPDDAGRTPADWAAANAHARLADVLATPAGLAGTAPRMVVTGIKGIDLFSPIARGGLTRVAFVSGVGVAVLLGEISYRFVRAMGLPVVWTGFDPAPLDRGDLAHFLAESGLASSVTLNIVARSLDGELRREGLAAALQEAVSADGQPGLVVLFEEDGFLADTEASYIAAARLGLTVVVVTPVDAPAYSDGAPFTSVVRFSREVASRSNFPALDVPSSRGAAIEPAPVAEARGLVASRAAGWEAVEAFLTQPFFTTEPFTSTPGERVEPEAALEDLARLMSQPTAWQPRSLRYRGRLA